MSDSEQKTKEPTQRKLRKQREKGVVATSRQVTSFTSTSVGVAAVVLMFGFFLEVLLNLFEASFRRIDQPFKEVVSSAIFEISYLVFSLVFPVVLIVFFIGGLISIVYNRGPVFSINPIIPKFERMFPGANLKKIFGSRGLFEFSFTLCFLLSWIAVFIMIFYSEFRIILSLHRCGFECSLPSFLSFFSKVMWFMFFVFFLAAGLESILQKFLFVKEQKMSETELRKERKDQFGSPEIRKERNRLRKQSQGDAENVGADKANMAFFWKDCAIGIRYHPVQTPVPKVTARAYDAGSSMSLRNTVAANGFPEEENEIVLDKCIGISPGSSVNEDVFTDLALAMRRMFK